MLRTRLLEALPTEEEAAIDDSGFDVSMRVLGEGELAGWLADARSAAATRVGDAPGRPLAGRHRRPDRAGVRDRGGRGVRLHRQARPRRRGGAGDLARGPGAAQGAPRRQGPDAGLRRARHAAGRASSATPRCRRTSPGPTSAPTTSPTSPSATSSASCKQGPGRRRPAQPRQGSTTRSGPGRRDRDAARPGGARPGRGARRRARGARRHPAAHRDRAAAGRPARADGADRHRRRRRPPQLARGPLRRPR